MSLSSFLLFFAACAGSIYHYPELTALPDINEPWGLSENFKMTDLRTGNCVSVDGTGGENNGRIYASDCSDEPPWQISGGSRFDRTFWNAQHSFDGAILTMAKTEFNQSMYTVHFTGMDKNNQAGYLQWDVANPGFYKVGTDSEPVLFTIMTRT